MLTQHRHISSLLRLKLILTALLTSAIVGQLISPTGAQQASHRHFRSGPGVILLTNGEVMQGNVQPFDTYVEIRLDDTGSVSLTNDRVNFIAATLEEVYQFQISMVRGWTINEHFRLARWCMKQGMFDHAMAHYVYLKREIPERTEFRQFELEFRNVMFADPATKAALASTQPVSTKAESDENRTAAQTAQPNNLDRQTSSIINHLQKSDHDDFLRDIQPVLMSNCAKSGCHGTFGTTPFTVLDTRRFDANKAYRENLQNFSQYVSRSSAIQADGSTDLSYESNLLFRKSTMAHGQQTSPPLDITSPRHQRYIELLHQWIDKANQPAETFAANHEPTTAQASVWLSAPPVRGGDSLAMPTNALPQMRYPDHIAAPPQSDLSGRMRQDLAQSTNGSAPVLGNQELAALSAAIAKLEAIEKDRSKQKDPFDPNEFNRKFGNGVNQ